MTRTSLLLACTLACSIPAAANAQCAGASTDPDAPRPVGCFEQDVDFHDGFSAIPSVSLDSGWVPADSPLQVRFALFVMAETSVDLGGTVVTSWPTTPRMRALSVAVPGRAGTGRLAMSYGIELVAQVRIHVTVAGVTYDWEGDIPLPGGIPTDLRLIGETTFDPFVLPDVMPRPISVSDFTDSVRVVSVGIGSLAGGSIPGIDGGFALDARGMLTTTYQSQRIEVSRALSPIIAEGAWVAVPPGSATAGFGPSQDMVVLPRGNIGYDGVVTLTPSLFVDLLGSHWELLSLDVPLRVVSASVETDFDAATVHVPLPDVRVAPEAFDFGRVAIGERAEAAIDVINDGEAELSVVVIDPGHDLVASPSTMTLPPRSRRSLSVTYAPTAPESLDTLLSLSTNDPDRALVAVALTATAFEAVATDAAFADAGALDASAAPSGPSNAGGCGCRAGGRAGSPGLALAALALAVVATRRARRSR